MREENGTTTIAPARPPPGNALDFSVLGRIVQAMTAWCARDDDGPPPYLARYGSTTATGQGDRLCLPMPLVTLSHD
jgi:hypothetical protein